MAILAGDTWMISDTCSRKKQTKGVHAKKKKVLMVVGWMLKRVVFLELFPYLEIDAREFYFAINPCK